MTSQYYTNEHIGQSQFYYWYGQVLGDWEKNENDKLHNKDDIPGWGKRYKVAILGRDSRVVDKGAKNEELAMCEVLLPVTAGSGLGGGAQTVNIAQNTFVMGFYKDGINCREPIIIGLLPNYSQTLCKSYDSNESERFNPASGYDPTNLSHYVPDYNLWLKYGGWPIKESNDTGTVNGADAARKKQYDDGKRTHYIPSPAKCDGNGGEMFGIAQALQDAINLINKIRQEVLTYSNAISSIQSTIRNIINTVSLQISILMKNMIQKMRGFVLNQINKAITFLVSLLFPNLRHAANTATEKIMEILNCVFNKIIDKLLKMITNLVENTINNAVNMAMSAVENFVGGALSNILGTITSGIDSALSAASGILGSALQIGGSPLNALDLVFGFIKFFVCDEELNCPNIKQWSFWYGTNNYTPKIRKNVSKVLAGIASTASAGIGSTAIAAGIGSTSVAAGIGSTSVAAGIGSTSVAAGIGSTSVAAGIGSTAIAVVNTGIGTTAFVGIGTTAVIIIGIGTSGVVRRTEDNECAVPEGTAPVLCRPPEIELIGGGGSGFEANAIISSTGNVIGFDIINQGSGYTSTPIVSFYSNCGKGSGAVLFPVVSNGKIEKIIILDGGTGYLSAPDGSTGGGGQQFSTVDQTVTYTPSTNQYDVFNPDELVEFEQGDLIFMPAGTQADLYDIDGNVIQTVVGSGQITCTKIRRHGVMTIPKPPKPPNKPDIPTNKDCQYSVLLELEEIVVTNEGLNYNEGDEIIIEPDYGTEVEPKFDAFGRLISVKILKKGMGCPDTFNIYIKSKTGINARMSPVFKVIRIGDLPQGQDMIPNDVPIINVVDCVGKVI